MNSGIIKESSISFSDIKKYTEVKLINAMMDINETEGIPISNIIAAS
ncbi:MAG: hypothetical protein IPJ37_22645 [Bacteroidales bacterium]|nr:hypothetical protein [Bacteroidales bacterium]